MSINVIEPSIILQQINMMRLMNGKKTLKVTGLSQQLLRDNVQDILTGTIQNKHELDKIDLAIQKKIYDETYGDEVEIYNKKYPIQYNQYYHEPWLLKDEYDYIAVQAIQYGETTFIKTLLIK